MGTFVKQAKTQNGNGERTRVAVAVPITIRAKDKLGQSIREESHTIVISKLGVKLVTTHELPIGTEITIENHENGRTSEGYIVWAADRHSSSEPNEVGAYLPDGEFLWELDLPSEGIGSGVSRPGLTELAYDGVDEPLMAVSSKLPEADALGTRLVESPPSAPTRVPGVDADVAGSAWNIERELTPTETPVRAERHRTAEWTPPAVLGLEAPAAGSGDRFNSTLETTLKTFARRTSEAAEEQSRAFEQKLHRFAEQFFAGAQARLERSPACDDASAEFRTKAFEKRLYEISEEILSLTQSNVVAAARQAQESASEAYSKQVEESLQKISQRITQQMELLATNLVSQAHERLQAKVSAAVDTMIENEFMGRLERRLNEFQSSGCVELTARLEEAYERQQETLLARLNKDSEDVVANALAQLQTEKGKPTISLALQNLRRLW